MGYKLLVVFAFLWSGVLGQSILDNIPDSLMDGANTIVIDEQFEFEVFDISSSQIEYSKTYIVLKENLHMVEVLPFDEFKKIKSAYIKVFDGNGDLLKKYKLKDFHKYAGTDRMTVAHDNGMKWFRIPQYNPPYKVQFYYKIKSKANLFYPTWNPLKRDKESVLNASFKVVDNTFENIRYNLHNIEDPKETKTTDYTLLEWGIKNKKYVQKEKYATIEDAFPLVNLAAKDFEIDGYKGDLSSWKSIGDWINLLNSGRNNLTSEEKEEIKLLVEDTHSDLEKVRIVYRYLQESTRYASIQLGIGGWQPYKTSFVHEKKYGDCKGLTFYTQSMLEAVGVPSYYTLVMAGDNVSKVDPKFPSAAFNHAFLMVPIEKDTFWLECTSQTAPFGFLGSFTDDRNVLVVKEDGGHLIRTKRYKADENISLYNVDIDLTDLDNTKIIINRSLRGKALTRNNFYFYLDQSKEKQREWLLNNTKLGPIDILDFNISQITGDIVPQADYQLSINCKGYIKKAGSRLLFKPFVFNEIEKYKLYDIDRKYNLQIDDDILQLDTVNIIIPNGYKLDRSIKEMNISNNFGNYVVSYKIEGNKIQLTRKLNIYRGIYLAKEYQEFTQFIKKVSKKDRTKVILSKRQE